MPRTPLYFDDYQPGHVFEAGSRAVTAEEIVAFARDYDPQSFHVDAEAARDSIFGGLVASGWHTASLMMRLFADNVLCPESSLGSPGVDELRWANPVRPGDTLTLRVTVVQTRRSQSKPDRGIVTLRWEAVNQHGQPVLTLTANGLVRVRP